MKYIVILVLLAVLYPALPDRINLTTLTNGFLFGITLAFCLMDGMAWLNEEIQNERT